MVREAAVGVIANVALKGPSSTLEATQGQIDGLFRQLRYKCHQNREASVGDSLEICPWVTSRVVSEYNPV